MYRKRLNINKLRSLVGDTPLVKITDKIYAKYEIYNPSGSIKDRAVSHIIRRELIYGNITEDTILCEASSGNTGVSLSMHAANLNNKCIVFVPKDVPLFKKKAIEVYGAQIIDTPPGDLTGAIAMRDAFLRANDRAWTPDQFSNALNIDCHERHTAPEIHKQVIDIGKRWSGFVYGSGTGGTIEGVRRYLAQNNSKTRVCMVVPKEDDHGFLNIGLGREYLTSLDNMDKVVRVGYKEAKDRANEFTRKTGFLVGPSSGANILASERWVAEHRPAGIIVTVICDRGNEHL